MVKDVGCTHSLGPDFKSARETQGGLATKDTGADFCGGRNRNNGHNLGIVSDIVPAKELCCSIGLRVGRIQRRGEDL